jgi:polysaccharide biosynthesis protein PslH
MGRVRLLFVAPRFPYPPMQGDRRRAYELLRRLRERYAITLVAPDAPDSARHAAELCDRWVPVAGGALGALAATAAAAVRDLPLQVGYYCPPALRAAARRLLGEGRYDLIHLHTARVGPIVADAIAARVPAVVDLIDALSLNMRRRAERERAPRRWIFAAESRRMARYEQWLLRHVAAATIVAAPDCAALGAPENLHVVPLGVDLDRFSSDGAARDPATLVFSGRMAYFPNADAAQFLAAEILPLVRAQIPGARLRIVGADPTPATLALRALPGVEVTGYVERVEAELRRATLAVAPMRAGTGLQFKILEAMACGAPVVATPLALAGIEAVDGVHALAADGPRALADAIVRVCSQPELAQGLARAGRRLVESRYTWGAAVESFDQIYADALRGPGVPHAPARAPMGQAV